MSDRQRTRYASTCSLLVYGSLMDRRELARCGLAAGDTVPVIASGFCREFSQEPSWRRGLGNDRGVLTIRRAADCSLNAVLVTNVPTAALTVLDHRERGYLRRMVSRERLSPFGPDPLPAFEENIFSYEGRPELYNSALRPNPEYLAMCVGAASLWGERFRRKFQQTTFVTGSCLGSAHV